LVAVKKVLAEGTPAEVLTILGWQIDTCRLIIQLPDEKASIWDSELKSLITDGNKGLLIGLKRPSTGRNSINKRDFAQRNEATWNYSVISWLSHDAASV
jgi:hypothetical protein